MSRKPDAWFYEGIGYGAEMRFERKNIIASIGQVEYPLFRRTPEDDVSLRAAAGLCEYHGRKDLAAKLREMAGDAP